VHCLPGNHDSLRIMTELLNTPPFHFCDISLYGDWCLIMLNSAVRWDDGGRLEASELQVLERALREHPDHHTLIAMHHHPVPMGSLWLDGLNLRNADEFFAVIDQYPQVRGVTWGHVHQAKQLQRNDVVLFSTPSTNCQFLPNSDAFMMDSLPPGYRWIDLQPDGAIDTEVVWLE